MTKIRDVSTPPIQILLVEDSAGDARLTREAFKDAKVHMAIHVVSDGVEAIEFLTRQNGFGSKPRPDLILLDLNLPRKDGREVLTEIKANPSLRSIPVVILSTSSACADVESSYLLHANCYIIKPLDMEGFLAVVRSIDNFWLSVVKLPSVATP
jgi:CheY-like chemotaxis protein